MARQNNETLRKTLLKGRAGVLGRFLLALVLGGLIALFLYGVGKRFALIDIPIPALVLSQGVLAALLSWAFALEWWWSAIQIVLPVLVLIVGAFPLPGWIFPVVLIAWVLVFWNSIFARVPLFLTNRATSRALEHWIAPYRDGRVLDVGHGFAGVLTRLANVRPDATFIGCESAPFPFVVSWLRLAMGSRKANVQLYYRSFWSMNFDNFDVVYAFLSPAPMAALFGKVRREMRPGSLFISNSFAVDGMSPDATVCVDDRRKTRLLIWRI